MYYLTETDPRGAMGLGGKDEVGVGAWAASLSAIDYKTGKTGLAARVPGRQRGGGGAGLLTTAGKLLFAGDGGGQPRRVRCRQRQAVVAHAHRGG